MDLRDWITDELVSARHRLEDGVLARIPPERRGELADGGGIPPTYVLWHLARHHDLAVNGVLRGDDEVVHDHTAALGVDTDLWRGLAEGADLHLVQVLDPDAVGSYALAVLDRTIAWIRDGATLDTLDAIPASTDALTAIETPEDDFGWLYAMWDGKPAHWFLSWEGMGHVVTHTGELVSIRNRMGLSPF